MKAAVDRIEGDMIIFILFNEKSRKFSLPIDMKPDIHEGDIVDIEIRKDSASSHFEQIKTRERINYLKKQSF